MSIVQVIEERVRERRLFLLEPRAAGTSPKRVLLIEERLWDFLNEPGPDDDWEERKGFLLADLEVFAAGEPIGPKYLFLLYRASEGVWEIRSVRPQPSIRILGRFAQRDVFVATNFALREELGEWQSREWRNVKITARTKWVNLFHTYQPLISTNVSDVVSGAINGKYFKDH
jgi:hypothetical protein